jgi:hypothetical protein
MKHPPRLSTVLNANDKHRLRRREPARNLDVSKIDLAPSLCNVAHDGTVAHEYEQRDSIASDDAGSCCLRPRKPEFLVDGFLRCVWPEDMKSSHAKLVSEAMRTNVPAPFRASTAMRLSSARSEFEHATCTATARRSVKR